MNCRPANATTSARGRAHISNCSGTPISSDACGRRVTVTGGSGFVGANLVRALLGEGARVCAFTRRGSDLWRLDEVSRDVDIVEVDVRDADAVERAMHAAKPEWVFHLAARGNASWHSDEREIDAVVIEGTANVIRGASAAGCAVLVNGGSSSEYGFKNHAPAETEPPEPNSAYARAKLSATRFACDAAAQLAMRVVTLRLYSVYGPWEDPRRLLPTLIVRGLAGEWPPLVNADTARDFVWIDDVVDAFRRAAASAASGAVYNVGTGRQTTVREVVELARGVLRVPAAPEWGTMPARLWDTASWIADARAIRADLAWSPAVTLEQGFKRFVAWFEHHAPMLAHYRRTLGLMH
jgi:nucleoside-diphosphate-sugar epimerase